MNEHRNVVKKHYCPGCDHFHGQAITNVPGSVGVCLKEPPTVFVIGMLPSAASVVRGDQQPELVPVIRSFYPPLGPTDSCAQWTPRAEGEA